VSGQSLTESTVLSLNASLDRLAKIILELALQDQVTLIHEVLKPLVKDDIASPAAVQLGAMDSAQSSQFRMPVLARESHGFCQLTVEIHANFHIRIGNAPAVLKEKIGQRQSDGVTTALKYLDVQITISCNARSVIAVKSIQLRDESV
jgi:hypothetical protein